MYTYIPYTLLPIYIAYAVENVWITALMIHYQTPDVVDAFIWILPNILTILIKPYLIRHVHRHSCPRSTEYLIVLFGLLVGALGCVGVGLSIGLGQVGKIALCTLGWTLMDMGFQFVEFFLDKHLQHNDATHVQLSTVRWSGLMVGYGLSGLLCWWNRGKGFKKFRQNSSILYLFVGALTLITLLLLLEIKLPSWQEWKKLMLMMRQDNHVSIVENPAFYLPGMMEVLRCDWQDGYLMWQYFIHLFSCDCVLIYASMWMIYQWEDTGMKEGKAYCEGMLYGSMLLALYTVVENIPLPSLSFLHAWLLVIIAVLSAVFVWLEVVGYGWVVLVGLVGLHSNIYTNHREEEVMQSCPALQSSAQFIDRMEKIIILCPMPFISMIVLHRDDIIDCLSTLAIFIAVWALYSIFIMLKSRKKVEYKGTKKVTKIQ